MVTKKLQSPFQTRFWGTASAGRGKEQSVERRDQMHPCAACRYLLKELKSMGVINAKRFVYRSLEQSPWSSPRCPGASPRQWASTRMGPCRGVKRECRRLHNPNCLKGNKRMSEGWIKKTRFWLLRSLNRFLALILPAIEENRIPKYENWSYYLLRVGIQIYTNPFD